MTTASTKPRTRLRRNIAVATRWLHIYLSMVSFVVVLFFAVTGLTLNHPDWFTKQHTVERHETLPPLLLHASSADGVDQLGIAEWLRTKDRVHGVVSDFRVDESQISVSFRAPGYTADSFIDRSTGRYDLTVVENGWVAVLNDLHKGRDAGKAWGLLIDISAILLTLVSVTGLVLIWFVYHRRSSGLLLALAALLAVVLLFHFAVP